MRWSFVRMAAILAGSIAGVVVAPANAGAAHEGPAPSGTIAHGRYIVYNASLCIACHGAALRGGLVPGPAGERIVGPPLAGLPMFPSPESAVRFFKTGVNAAGHRVPPPMPPYRLSEGDARDVVAFLRSLKEGPRPARSSR